jgi:hypothetical protein
VARREVPKRVTYLSRASRNTGNICDLAVTRNLTFRDIADRVPDPLVAFFGCCFQYAIQLKIG